MEKIEIKYIELDMTSRSLEYFGNLQSFSELVLNSERIYDTDFIKVNKYHIPLKSITELKVIREVS